MHKCERESIKARPRGGGQWPGRCSSPQPLATRAVADLWSHAGARVKARRRSAEGDLARNERRRLECIRLLSRGLTVPQATGLVETRRHGTRHPVSYLTGLRLSAAVWLSSLTPLAGATCDPVDCRNAQEVRGLAVLVLGDELRDLLSRRRETDTQPLGFAAPPQPRDTTTDSDVVRWRPGSAGWPRRPTVRRSFCPGHGRGGRVPGSTDSVTVWSGLRRQAAWCWKVRR